MNIVHVVESLEVGGLERCVLTLTRAQRDAGHAVRIVCLFIAGALAEDAAALGIGVEVCGKRDGIDFGALRRLRALLAAGKPYVVHTHNAVAHYYTAGALPARRGPRLVNTRHGMGAWPYSRKREALYRAALLRTDAVALVCEAARRSFVDRGVVPAPLAHVVHNGIDLRQTRPRSEQHVAALRRVLGVSEASLLLGTVGRLNAAKDHANLLDAMAMLRARGVDCALMVAGDGELRGALQQRGRALGLEACVHWLGARNDVPDLLAGLDLFVLSSLTEGYSMALVEAAAAGLPMVATDVGGNREIVTTENGLLVPAADAQALALVIARLAAEPAIRRRMGKAARSWALRHGDVGQMAVAYAGLYDSSGATPGASVMLEQP